MENIQIDDREYEKAYHRVASKAYYHRNKEAIRAKKLAQYHETKVLKGYANCGKKRKYKPEILKEMGIVEDITIS